MPASSLALTQRAPDGRTATSKVAFATSMPTNTAGSLISTSAPGVPSSWPSLATCGVVPRSTVRAPDEQWTTPQLKHGLEDQRQDELSPTVRSYVRSEHTSGNAEPRLEPRHKQASFPGAMIDELKQKLQAEVERLNHEINFVLPKEIERARATATCARTPSIRPRSSGSSSLRRG